MMNLLITGFLPFDRESINPSQQVLSLLPEILENTRIYTEALPVEFEKSAGILMEAVEKYRPSIVLCLGQASGRSGLSIEKTAINWQDARIADSAGFQPVDQPVCRDAPAAYFSNLPVRKMVQASQAAGIPAAVSYSAGTYVCNDLFFRLLHWIDTKYPDLHGGFIHLPYLPVQTIDKPAGTPSMCLEDAAKGVLAALEAAIHEIAEEQKDEDVF